VDVETKHREWERASVGRFHPQDWEKLVLFWGYEEKFKHTKKMRYKTNGKEKRLKSNSDQVSIMRYT
jgi:hypothetical protein